MAQGYRTAQPSFVDDFVYQPPWELMQLSLAQNQSGYDNALTQTQAIDGLLNIAHRNSQADSTAANEIKQYYESRVNDITNTIQANPKDWRKSQRQLRDLTKEIQSDRTSGNIAKLEGTYGAYQTYLKNAEEQRKKNPKEFDNATYQYGLNSFDKKWGGDSINNGIWQGEELFQRPDLLNAKNLMELAVKVPAYKNANIVEAPNGGYIISQGGKSETLSKDKLLQAIVPAVLSDPSLQPYLDQQQRFGIPGAEYFQDVNGQRKLIDPYTVTYRDATGKSYTQEEAVGLSPAEQSTLQKDYNFANNPLGNILKYGTSFEYNNSEKEFKIKEDSKTTHDLDRTARKDNLVTAKNMDMAKMVKEYELKGNAAKEKIKYDLWQLALEGDDTAQVKLDTMFAKESFGFIPVNPVTYNTNLELSRAGDREALNKEQLARDYARKDLGYKQGTEEHNFLQFIDGKLQQGVSREAAIKEFLDTQNKNVTSAMNASAPYSSGYEQSTNRYNNLEPVRERLTDKYSKILEKYEEKKSAYFDKNSSAKGQTELQPVEAVTGTAIQRTINTNPNSFYTTNSDGDILSGSELKKVQSVTHAFGANAKEKLGTKVVFEDGTEGYVFPKSSRAGNIQTTTLKNLILDNGLVEKKAGLYKELSNERLLDLQTQFESAYPDDTGTKKLIYNVGEGVQIPIHKTGNVFYIVNPDNPSQRTPYNNLKDIIDLIY